MKIYLIFFLFLLLPIKPTLAKNDIFFIKNLKIISKNESPILARKNALKTARRRALKKILRSLNIDPNFNEILSPNEVAQMTHSEQIKNEKILEDKYSAYFTFKFLQNFTENILIEKNIFSGIEKREKYLILPLKITDKNYMIFLSKKNNWQKSWEEFLIESHENIYLFNKNNPELRDIKKISPYKFLSLEQKIVNELLNNNEDYIPIIAVYKYDKTQNEIKIKLRIIRKYEDKILNLTLINTGFLSEKKFTKEAIKKILLYIEKNRFKSKKIGKISININIESESIEDINETKLILNNIKELDSVKISSVSKKYSIFKITYNNSYDIFEIFDKHDLSLQINKNNEYYIK
jgi:hypothetical protein